jgi:hypothetical protein
MYGHSPLRLAVVLWGLTGCHGAPDPAVPSGPPSASGDEDGPLDISGLSREAKVRFEADRIRIVDSDSNASSYGFVKTGDVEITEQEFVERYRRVTGQSDIDRASHANPGTPLIALGTLAIVAGVVGGAAILATEGQTNSTCVPGTNGQTCFQQSASSSSKVGVVAGILSFAVLGGVGISVAIAGVHTNQTSRRLSRDDAERFARRYNRALLREVQGSPEEVERQRANAGARPQ